MTYERNAAKQLLPAIFAVFPQHKLIMLEDSLQANVPHIKQLKNRDIVTFLWSSPVITQRYLTK